MAFFSTSFFAICLSVGEDGHGPGHLCHIDTFLVFYNFSVKVTHDIFMSYLFLFPVFSKKSEGDMVFSFPWCVMHDAWCVVPSLW